MINTKELEISHSFFRIAEKEYLLNLELNTKSQPCKGTHFVCCIDVSGSMSDASSQKDVEAGKFSRWDLVKHSLVTIISSLNENDQLSVISFSNDSNLEIPFTKMTKQGKKKALEKLNKIVISGGTNLWAGLEHTMDYISQNVEIGSEGCCYALVLTDGEPNQNPKMGIMHEFKQKYDTKAIKSTISCFGFGYSLDSSLLREIAEYSGGYFNHIPDHSMVNSTFINFLSNSLASSFNKIDIHAPKNISYCLSHPKFAQTIKLGSLQEGQPQNVIIRLNDVDSREVDLEFKIDYDGSHKNYQIKALDCSDHFVPFSLFECDLSNDQFKHLISSPSFSVQYFKMCMLHILEQVIKNSDLKNTCGKLDQLYDCIERFISLKKDELSEKVKSTLEAYLKDIKSGETNEGQLYKSVSSLDWFKTWGIHYLKYFIRSHQLQTSTNYKDSSLQIYGGQSFQDIKSKVEDIFSKIPAPKPSRGKEFTGNYQKTFYCRSGGCVDGNGLVKTLQGTKKVRDLKKGDVVVNSNGQRDTILCVLKRKIDNGYLDMLSFNGMKITAYHPIRLDSNWVFPVDVAGYPLKINVDYVYNFVLQTHHFLTINDVDVITLGHGYTFDCLAHPFFGTQKIIDQLKSHNDWNAGLIEYKYNPSYDQKGLVSSLW